MTSDLRSRPARRACRALIRGPSGLIGACEATYVAKWAAVGGGDGGPDQNVLSYDVWNRRTARPSPIGGRAIVRTSFRDSHWRSYS